MEWQVVQQTVALPLKGNEFQANHNPSFEDETQQTLLLYLSKVTNFKQITTPSLVFPKSE